MLVLVLVLVSVLVLVLVLVLRMMWISRLTSRSQQNLTAAAGDAEKRGGQRRKLPKLKNPAKLWRKNRREQNHKLPEDREEEQKEEEQEEEQQEEEALQEVSRRLISREEQLFSQDRPRPRPSAEAEAEAEDEDEDRLQKDLEELKLQIWMAVHDTFTSSSSSSSSSQLHLLRSAVASIQQQEEQDRRWADRDRDRAEDRVPVWRPLRWRSTHNALLQKMVESRLEVQEEELSATGLSSALKREVCCRGRRVKDDLLTVVRTVIGCYPPETDVLNVYAALYHQNFSARLTQLATAALDQDDCSYLLFWVNHHYPRDVLQHEELRGKVKTACLGSLLLQEHLDRLEDQYLSHREDKVKLWLSTALKKEEESWLTGATPELIDTYYFSPLAIDVIQVVDGSLTEFTCVIRDQSQSQRITAHLEAFLSSYRKSLEEFVKGNHGNVHSVVKAQLVCEEQLRDYITGPTGSLSEQQRRVCLETLSALKDCGYRCLTGPVHTEMKVCFRDLWTGAWLDGSRPVVPSLLDALSRHLRPVLTHLKPSCSQSVLSELHQDLVLRYVKRMMKSRMKSREQQVGGAQRMKQDAETIDDCFTEMGCLGPLWSSQVLLSMVEVLRLQDPGSVQLEMVSLARSFPDLSDVHVSALLSLKTGLSAADVRSIRKSVEENRLLDVSTNQSPPFFSKVKVKWIHEKRNKMGL